MGIEGCTAVMPNTPQVLVFDTAFHQTMPEYAYTYPIPYEMIEKYKIRRYGAHGTSHRFVAREMAKLMDKPVEETKIITCHIGNGSSISAVKGGKCIDTTMGFTPLEGIPMGTRCGSMDPAIVTYLMDKLDLDVNGINAYMNKKSGVYGISGISSDFRDLHDAAEKGDEKAKAALRVFAYNVKKYIGAYAAALNGVDGIVFTAGIGENDRVLRAMVLEGLDYLGVDVDFEYNNTCPRGEEAELSTKNSKVKVFVIPTDEEMMIAQQSSQRSKIRNY